MNPEPRNSAFEGAPLGLALSAGGAKGAYQIGCWKAFRELGIEFSAISGSSIGALNAALICQGDLQTAQSLWYELTRIRIIQPDYEKLKKVAKSAAIDLGLLLVPIPNIKAATIVKYAKYAAVALRFGSGHGAPWKLLREGLGDTEAFKELLKGYLDMSAVMNANIDLYVTAMTSPGFSLTKDWSRGYRIRDLGEEQAWDLLCASMALPLLFAPVELMGERLLDGGIAQWLPVEPLFDAGYRRIVAVGTKTGARAESKRYPADRIILIQPKQALGRFPVATFRFTERAIEKWTAQGYEDALRVLEKEF